MPGTLQELRRKKEALGHDEFTDSTANSCWHNKPQQEEQSRYLSYRYDYMSTQTRRTRLRILSKTYKMYFPLSVFPKIFIMGLYSPQTCIPDFQLPGNVEISLPRSQSALYLQLQKVLTSMKSRRKAYSLTSVALIEIFFALASIKIRGDCVELVRLAELTSA